MKNSTLRILLILAAIVFTQQVFAQTKTPATSEKTNSVHQQAISKLPVPKSTLPYSARKTKSISEADRLEIYKKELAKLVAISEEKRTELDKQKIIAFKQLIDARTKRLDQIKATKVTNANNEQ